MRGSTRARTAMARIWIPRPMNGATSPIAIAQPNIASVSGPGCGRSGTISENVPRPVMLSRPRKISDPMPAASSPGTSTTPEHRPAEPGRLEQQERAQERRSEQRADRGEAPGRGDHGGRLRGRVARREADGERAEPAADRDQRRLRAEHRAERERGERGEEDPRQLDRGQRAARVEAVGGRVAAGARQVADRQRHEQPRQREQRQRPPDRRRIEPERVRQVVEQQRLQLRDQLEEPVRDGGDRDADQRRQHEQLHIGAGAQQRDRIGSGRARRIRRGHPSDPAR